MPDQITLAINGQKITVERGCTVAAALARHRPSAAVITRRALNGQGRGPLCGMGICQECRVTINGNAHQLACQTRCAAGMSVITGDTL